MRCSRLDSSFLARVIVRAAALLVPGEQRKEWAAEWTAELWHVCHRRRHPCDGREDGPEPGAALRFASGAIRDALLLGCDHLHSVVAPDLARGSAARCALFLVSGVAAAFLLCLCVPGARKALLPLPYRNARSLVLVQRAGSPGIEFPTIRLADYLEWRTDTSRLFSQLAFYRPEAKNVYLPRHRMARLTLALASPNLLQLLGLPERNGQAVIQGAQMILRQGAWQRIYRGDSHILGHRADVDGIPVPIAGILPDDSWRLPGEIDGILLEDQQHLGELPPNARGFVVARIRDAAFPPPRSGSRFMSEVQYGVASEFDCVSLRYLQRQPTFGFLILLVLACLALPATTALPLGEYPRLRDRMRWTVHARRWAFLVMKFLLVLPIAYLGSIALASAAVFGKSATLWLQLITTFPALLIAFRWILQDQRRRCPVCLRRLSNPARVGQIGCNFLAWNGTELFCSRGHGLLYIPEMPTSWFGTQRWLCLDPSWLCLFPDGRRSTPELI